jgi:hypothetical protein
VRLLDLNASFIGGYESDEARTLSHIDTMQRETKGVQGVMFQCPACAVGLERGEEIDGERVRRFVRGAHYIIVWFANPTEAPVVPTSSYPGNAYRWTASGDTLDTLSLTPSINLDTGRDLGCKWHGYVTNGDAQ